MEPSLVRAAAAVDGSLPVENSSPLPSEFCCFELELDLLASISAYRGEALKRERSAVTVER